MTGRRVVTTLAALLGIGFGAPASRAGCPACVALVPAAPITNTYTMASAVGPGYCLPTAPLGALGPCVGEVACGGVPLVTTFCMPTPWLSVGGIAVGGVPGIPITFSTTAGPPPICSHPACVPCGPPVVPCPGTPGSPLLGCCSTPGYAPPAFFLPGPGLCVRVDQTGCGDGVANSSLPQTGDNDVARSGDTTNPGADCIYGTADDPPPLACILGPGGAGADNAGQITRALGNFVPDALGIHYRLRIPLRVTVFIDGGGCPPGATFDLLEPLASQTNFIYESTTASSTALFADASFDGCALVGAGFPGPGPVIGVGVPQPYGGGPNIQVATGIDFSGPAAALFDVGSVAITPYAPLVVAPPAPCACAVPVGCPE